MAQYIDGFVFPIPSQSVSDYQRIAKAVSEIWIEHGAMEYREFVGDDLQLEGTRSFIDVVAATGDQSVVFGWVVFESREARDLANEKVAADSRMTDLIQPLLGSTNPIFDAQRMAYGGFKPLIQTLRNDS